MIVSFCTVRLTLLERWCGLRYSNRCCDVFECKKAKDSSCFLLSWIIGCFNPEKLIQSAWVAIPVLSDCIKDLGACFFFFFLIIKEFLRGIGFSNLPAEPLFLSHDVIMSRREWLGEGRHGSQGPSSQKICSPCARKQLLKCLWASSIRICQPLQQTLCVEVVFLTLPFWLPSCEWAEWTSYSSRCHECCWKWFISPLWLAYHWALMVILREHL